MLLQLTKQRTLGVVNFCRRRIFTASLLLGRKCEMGPPLKIGLFADMQYGDFDDRTNYVGTRIRFYRNGLDVLKRAVDIWRKSDIDLIIQMGDLIDGFNAFEFFSTQSAMTEVMAVIRDRFPDLPVFHVIGNHELYNYSRNELPVAFPFPDCYGLESYTKRGSRACYFQPLENIAFIIIDNYEFSMLGYPEQTIYDDAKEFLMTRNPNHHELNASDGMAGLDVRFRKFNGSVTPDQLAWLDTMLKRADDANLKTIIAGHLPVEPESCTLACLDWRHEDILPVIRRHESVVAYIAGHDHAGGYARDHTGIHHITFQGIIETPPGADCFATLNIFSDRIEIVGYGNIPSRVCHFGRTM